MSDETVSQGALINTMVKPKEVIEAMLTKDSTPAAFKKAFTNAALAPQGKAEDMVVQFGCPVIRFHINPGKKSFPKTGDTFKIENLVLPVALPGKEEGASYHAGGALGKG